MKSHHRLLRLGSVALLAAAGALFAVPAQADSGVPFQDRNVNGFIGICDKSGHQITSGKLTDAPFVWRAVSSVPAPKYYFQKGDGKVFLGVYQPRQGVDPGEWTGKQYTDTSAYTNPNHPMAQGTTLDQPLFDFTSVAPLWNGLLQLRMIYTGVNLPVHRRPYPATVIKVTGDTWTVVGTTGTVSCTDGNAVSDTTINNPKAIPSVAPSVVGGEAAATSPAVGATAANGAESSPSGSLGASGGDTSASGPDSGSTSISPWLVIGLIALPVAGIAGGFALARRSPASSEGGS